MLFCLLVVSMSIEKGVTIEEHQHPNLCAKYEFLETMRGTRQC